jgi:Insulin-induced protein (INSIG)
MVPSSLLPSVQVGAKLFVTGMTVGPLVDSLHNQCLLEYDFLPIALNLPESAIGSSAPILSSSWLVPPLLGIAYVILGGILPRWINLMLNLISNTMNSTEGYQRFISIKKSSWSPNVVAIVAVTTTACIIKFSEILETNSWWDASTNYWILLFMALLQWFSFDGTAESLLAASITSVGGPLSELPFVAHHVWHYLPQAADYQPLQNIPQDSWFWEAILGKDYGNLALSTITGPCYFAVTMDAIALGRFFDKDDIDK